MKTYAIETPEALDRASDMVKWEKDRRKVLEIVKQWRGGQIEPVITLEISRSAQLYQARENGKKSLLASMYVAPARKWAEEAFAG